MSLTLRVDGDRWRAHLRTMVEAVPGLTPVIKGNGYGFGNARLARRAAWLGLDTVAIGTYGEIEAIASRFPGDLLVLTPWRPGDQQSGQAGQSELGAAVAKRVVHTVSRLADLEALAEQQPDARIVLERTTSMLRHGMSAPDLRAAGRALADEDALQGLRLEGVALHLPLAHGSHVAEVERLMTDVISASLSRLGRRGGRGGQTIWVSHLEPEELARLNVGFGDFTFRPRVGTDLWLGDRGALRVTATVQDVHPVERGDVFGYRGRTAPRAGYLLVVSGGTAHGIGLEAPLGDASIKSRAATVARGGLDAVGFVRSPFSIGGKQRLFAEPPHMQASMLFLPGPGAPGQVPQVGDEVDVRVRFTATDVDRVEIS